MPYVRTTTVWRCTRCFQLKDDSDYCDVCGVYSVRRVEATWDQENSCWREAYDHEPDLPMAVAGELLAALETANRRRNMTIEGLRHTPTNDEVEALMKTLTREDAFTVPPWVHQELVNAVGIHLAAHEFQSPMALGRILWAMFYLGVGGERERWDVDPRPKHPAEDAPTAR